MTLQYYQDLLNKAEAKGMFNLKSYAARVWFRAQAQNIRNINANTLIKSDPSRWLPDLQINRPLYGKMIMYFYDPKWKHTLPYYDRFPVGFIVERADGGHFLLNMHYLPPYHRAKLLDLLRRKTIMGQGENQRLRISYEILKEAAEYKAFRPAFKRYLSKHVKSRMFVVAPDEWDVALFLPLAKWEKGGKDNDGRYGGAISVNTIYADSRRQL